MRPRRCLVARIAISVVALAACGDGEEAASSDTSLGGFGRNDAPSSTGAPAPGTSGGSSGSKGVAAEPELADVDPETKTHPEVVQILMEGDGGWTWFCTGALVSSTVVVTAAHCLDGARFSAWEVVAPTLRAKPRVKGQPLVYDRNWSNVAHPDLGIVKLNGAIGLSRYAKLVDVTARVDGGERLETATIVRTAEKPEAPFGKTGDLPLFSTMKYGYTAGYGVSMYSHGGDSGAGMFLLVNGEMTHDVVAVEREPDPARKIDHLSRVDRAFIDWVAENGGS